MLREDEEAYIHQLLLQFLLVSVDEQIADMAARIRRLYRPHLGDSIIAATALLLNAPLVTRNVRDFKKIPDFPLIPF